MIGFSDSFFCFSGSGLGLGRAKCWGGGGGGRKYCGGMQDMAG